MSMLGTLLRIVADRAGQSGRGGVQITLDDDGDITGKFRAIRFDTAGAVKLRCLDPDGVTTHDYTRNVAAGERWDAAFIIRVWETGTDAGMVVDGWS